MFKNVAKIFFCICLVIHKFIAAHYAIMHAPKLGKYLYPFNTQIILFLSFVSCTTNVWSLLNLLILKKLIKYIQRVIVEWNNIMIKASLKCGMLLTSEFARGRVSVSEYELRTDSSLAFYLYLDHARPYIDSSIWFSRRSSFQVLTTETQSSLTSLILRSATQQ